MMPITCAEPKGEWKKNPVTLVKIVVTRKTTFQPSSRFAPTFLREHR
jgi:hypothetical protein